MEQETRANNQIDKSLEKMQKHQKETEDLSKSLKEMCKLCDHYKEQLTDLKAEETLMKRRFEMSSREMNKELQQCRKKIEQLERTGNRSRSLYNVNECPPDQIKDIYPDIKIEKETLEQIVKLQRLSAKKSEKIDFLEEHVNTLVLELQKKSKLLQSYILLEQCGTLPSNKMNNNKAKSAESNGARGALNSSRTADDNLTLESSQDINWKLQAVLEDALLRNITLKENVDTLGSEIENLNKLIISSCNFKIS
ncbi:hypothetical protein JTB14_036548 [Gonioctena quinquepunctata]|nr:hypothetical protein JTB14_036548 [Gonioctena quinquepunctata]